jgi:hypothetical protein
MDMIQGEGTRQVLTLPSGIDGNDELARFLRALNRLFDNAYCCSVMTRTCIVLALKLEYLCLLRA